MVNVTGMVTRIHKTVRGKLFLKEHRKAKGLSGEQVAGRLGIDRQSVYRTEADSSRLNVTKQLQWADALGVEPEDLWRPPGRSSLDGMVRDAPPDIQAMAEDIVRRLVSRAG